MVQIKKFQISPIMVCYLEFFGFQLPIMDVLIPQCTGDYFIRGQATFSEFGI